MKRRTKIVAIAVAGAVVVAAVIGVVASRKPKGVPVRIAKVERKDLRQLVTANGTVQAKSKVELSAYTMGQITALLADEGDRVKKGDLLLVIDQARYTAAVEARRFNLQALEAEAVRSREAAAQALRDRERAERQWQERIIPEADVERTRSLYEQALSSTRRAERQVEQARADLDAAADELAKTEIRAPIDGVVTRRNIELGEVVVTGTMNNPGTVLMTISDMATIEAVLEVDQTDVPQLTVGQPASVLIDAFPDKPFPAAVSEFGSSPISGQSALGGQATGTDYEVKVLLQSLPANIRPGLTVTADIETAAKKDVLALPIGALVLRQPEGGPPPANPEAGAASTATPGPETVTSRARDVEGVFVVKDGKVAFRPVTVGIKGELDVEVTEGVEEGEEIVVGPFRALRELRPGSAVVAEKGPARPGPES